MIRVRRTRHCPVLLRRALETARTAVIDLETTGLGRRDRIVAAGVLAGPDAHVLVTEEHRDLSSLPHRVSAAALAAALAPLATRPELELVAHNAVFDVGMLERAGVVVNARVTDTLKLLKLADGDRGPEADDGGVGTRTPRTDRRHGEPLTYRLKDVARHALGVRPLGFPGAAERLPFADLVRYLKSDLLVTRMLYDHLLPRLSAADRAYERALVSPLTPLLVRMTNTGVQADRDFVRSEGERLALLGSAVPARTGPATGPIPPNTDQVSTVRVFRPTYRCKATGQTKATAVYFVRHRGRRYPLHVTDKRLAEEKARRLVAELEGGGDPARHERAQREPVATLVAEFVDRLAGRAGPGHRDTHARRLRKLAAAAGATTLRELTAGRCEGWLRGCGLAARTRHHYTRLLKQFGRFLAATGRAPANPFAGLPAVTGIEQDRRLRRRALTEAEIAALLASVTRSRYRRLGLSGPERAMLYRLVLATGLRRDEAASLTPESFRLAADPPHVVVEARHTKNKQVAQQPVPAALAADLRAFLAPKPAGHPVWPVRRKDTAHMVRMDLTEAGIAAEQNGETVDMHGLRTTFGTLLARKGVPLALAQKLLRHCDPRLTSNIYTVAQLADLSREIEKLGTGRG